MEATGMMGMPTAQSKFHDADPIELERMMAEQVKKNAPEDVQEFISALQEDGVTAEEVDELRQYALAALSSPDAFPELVSYLVEDGLIEEEEAPDGYDAGFVLSILGLVGVAQELVAQPTQ